MTVSSLRTLSRGRATKSATVWTPVRPSLPTDAGPAPDIRKGDGCAAMRDRKHPVRRGRPWQVGWRASPALSLARFRRSPNLGDAPYSRPDVDAAGEGVPVQPAVIEEHFIDAVWFDLGHDAKLVHAAAHVAIEDVVRAFPGRPAGIPADGGPGARDRHLGLDPSPPGCARSHSRRCCRENDHGPVTQAGIDAARTSNRSCCRRSVRTSVKPLSGPGRR